MIVEIFHARMHLNKERLRVADAGMTTDEFISNNRLALREIAGKFCNDYNLKPSQAPQIILRMSIVRYLKGESVRLLL
jgi:hypothetical protein